MSEYTHISNHLNTTSPAAASELLPAPELQLGDIDKELLRHLPIQRKLAIGSPDDPLEHEADAVADKVMRMPENSFIQHKCAECEEEKKLQRKPLASSITPFIQARGTGGGIVSDGVTQKINSTKGNGNTIDSGTKSFMESRFGTDFSEVKIHTGDYAVQMSQELNAQAFTVGSDIYFNSGKYNPNSDTGKHLLAHELTHTLQQGSSKVQNKLQRVPQFPDSMHIQMQETDETQRARDTSVQGFARRLILLIDERITVTERGLENGGIWALEEAPCVIESIRQQELWLRNLIIQNLIGAMRELRTQLADGSANVMLQRVLSSSVGLDDDLGVLQHLAFDFLEETGYADINFFRIPHCHFPIRTRISAIVFFLSDPVRFGVLPPEPLSSESPVAPLQPVQRDLSCTETGRATGYVVNAPPLPMFDVREDERERFICVPRRGRVNLRELRSTYELIPTGIHGKEEPGNTLFSDDSTYIKHEQEADRMADTVMRMEDEDGV